jgi:hypothetical protein
VHLVARIDVILEQHRNPVERAARASRGALVVQRPGDKERVRVELQNRVQPGALLVVRGDALQVGGD